MILKYYDIDIYSLIMVTVIDELEGIMKLEFEVIIVSHYFKEILLKSDAPPRCPSKGRASDWTL